MNMHKNARLTPQGRLLLVERVTAAGWSVIQAAQAAGIPVRQGYRWLARYAKGVEPKREPETGSEAAPAETVQELTETQSEPSSGAAAAPEEALLHAKCIQLQYLEDKWEDAKIAKEIARMLEVAWRAPDAPEKGNPYAKDRSRQTIDELSAWIAKLKNGRPAHA